MAATKIGEGLTLREKLDNKDQLSFKILKGERQERSKILKIRRFKDTGSLMSTPV